MSAEKVVNPNGIDTIPNKVKVVVANSQKSDHASSDINDEHYINYDELIMFLRTHAKYYH